MSRCRHPFHVRELNEGSLVRDRPGTCRPSVFTRSVISTILCGTPVPARVCVVFLENEASRSRPCAFLHFLQPLSSETRGVTHRIVENKRRAKHLGRFLDSRCRSLGVFHDSMRHPPPRSSLGRFGDWIGLDLIGLMGLVIFRSLGVFHDSMRHPPPRSSLGRF